MLKFNWGDLMKKPIKIILIIFGFAVLCGIISNITGFTDTVKEKDTKEVNQTKEEQWKPQEIAKTNSVYRTTNYKNTDDSYPVINISSIEKKDGDIVINIGAPTTEFISYAFDNFLYADPKDVDGNSVGIDKINLIPVDGDVECQLEITGIENIDKVKWVEVGPYKTNDNNSLIFKVD